MNNKYNVLIIYSGDDEFKFMIKRIGEVSITRTRPIYLYNASVDIINDLRLLRRMLIEIKIGAKPEGAFKVYNMDDYEKKSKVMLHNDVNLTKSREEILDNSEIKAILRGNNGPIIEEEIVKVEEPKVENEVKEPETPDKEEVIKPVKNSNKKSTKKSSKKSTKKSSKK